MEGHDSDIDRSLPNKFAELVTLLTGILWWRNGLPCSILTGTWTVPSEGFCGYPKYI